MGSFIRIPLFGLFERIGRVLIEIGSTSPADSPFSLASSPRRWIGRNARWMLQGFVRGWIVVIMGSIGTCCCRLSGWWVDAMGSGRGFEGWVDWGF